MSALSHIAIGFGAFGCAPTGIPLSLDCRPGFLRLEYTKQTIPPVGIRPFADCPGALCFALTDHRFQLLIPCGILES